MTLACMPRSKELYHSRLDALDVEHRPEWQPGAYGPGSTCCNFAAKGAADANGVPLPAMKANELGVWLDSEPGRAAGWEECTIQRAGDMAELGHMTVGTLHEEPHGHIVVVRGRDEHGNVLVWQAGRHNFNSATLRQCFTVEQLQHVKFHTFP